MLVDSHCHLDYDVFDDQQGYLARARQNDVAKMLTISIKLSQFQKVMKAAAADEGIFASVGVHPLHVHEESIASVDELVALTVGRKVIALGESGLDYHYGFETMELQKQSFNNHIAAAQETMLPLVVHTRDAADDTLKMLETAMAAKEFSGVIHCFTQDMEFAKRALDMGFYISFSGIVTFASAKEIQEVVRTMPLHRMLLETDAPYLAPVPYRGQSNEPAFVKSIAEFVAQLRGIEYQELCNITTDNFHHLFKKSVSS
jgi:TatD DNase family protein